MWCVIYGKGTQLQVASTQNVPHVNDLNFTTLHLQITILYMFFSITCFPDEEFFKTCLTERKWLAHQNYAEKKIGHLVC